MTTPPANNNASGAAIADVETHRLFYARDPRYQAIFVI
jgi:hypothetical protein